MSDNDQRRGGVVRKVDRLLKKMVPIFDGLDEVAALVAAWTLLTGIVARGGLDPAVYLSKEGASLVEEHRLRMSNAYEGCVELDVCQLKKVLDGVCWNDELKLRHYAERGN